MLKLEHALITADLLNKNPTKKVMLLYEELFKLDVANGYLSRVLNASITNEIANDKNHLAQDTFSFLERQ